jgi:polar amino acid transport system substrate-binding protein
MKTIRIFSVLAAAILLAGASAAHADATLERIESRGTVVVGVVLSGPPYGYLDPATQQPGGLNIDLAIDIARRLGVKPETVAVVPANRVQFLQQGKVDLLIPTMQLNPERAEIMGYVPTPYGDAGGGFITRKGSGITGGRT